MAHLMSAGEGLSFGVGDGHGEDEEEKPRLEDEVLGFRV